MIRKLENILRSVLIPLGATVLVYLYWRQYECQDLWWFLAIIAAILIGHYYFFFNRLKKLN